MITFELSEEQQIAQSTIREFAQDVLRPVAQRADADGKIEQKERDAIWSTEIIQAQAAEEGRSPILNVLLLEELGAADATLALAVAAPMAFVQAIADQGSAKQRQALLAPFTSLRYQAATVAVMEPSFRFDAGHFDTKADRKGDAYTLSGVKAFVPMASHCSHFLVIAESDGAADAFIVPR